MECEPADPSVHLEQGHNDSGINVLGLIGRSTHIEAMHQNFTQHDHRRCPHYVVPPFSGTLEPVSKLADRPLTQVASEVVQCPIWCRAVTEDVTDHSELSRLGEMNKVAKHVTNTPTGAQRRGVSLIFVEFSRPAG